ncbi:hypothetical protein N0A02_06715 [Paraburkholderia acidicola]|uniref:Uncharacterized protein n=1 Tax=Paraburkholderia acidicola TaxID=1912599 RepID=A0ABV1LK22_9BURK
MAGQMEQGFRNDVPRAPDFTAAPTINMRQAEATGSQIDGGHAASAFQAMGNAFGQFFGNVNRSLETVDANIQATRKQEIQQQNKDLETQGAADAAAGHEADALWTDRSSYIGAYRRGVATTQATSLGQQYSDWLGQQPMDGSVDPVLAAKKFYEDHYGAGSGDREVDNQVQLLFSQGVRSMAANFHEKQAQTIEHNMTETTIAGVSANVQSPTGLSAEHVVGSMNSFLSITNGNQLQAAHLLFSTLGDSIQNAGQGLAAQAALERAGFDEKYPVEFAQFKEKALAQSQRAKEIGAAKSQSDLNMQLQAAIANGTATPGFIAGWMANYHRQDSIWGFGPGGLNVAEAEMRKASRQVAGVNVVVRAHQGIDGTNEAALVANKFGVPYSEIVTKHLPQAVTQLVQDSQGLLPNLAATANTNGLINPMADDKAATEYGSFSTTDNAQHAFLHQQPKYIEDMVSNALINVTDPAQSMRAYSIIDAQAKSVGESMLGNYYKDAKVLSFYHSVKALSPNGDPTQIMQYLKNNPADEKLLERASESGRFDWTMIYGKDVKPEDVQKKIRDSVRKQFLNESGNAASFNPEVGISTGDLDAMTAQMVINSLKLRGAGNLDVSAAADGVAMAYAQTRYGVTGQDGAVRMVANPFPLGAGRDLKSPLNATGPVGVDRGFPPIYASFPIKNAFDVVERPIETSQEDLTAMHGAFPGKTDVSPKKLSLGNPDAKLSGLMPVMDGSVTPIRFQAGEKITTLQLTGPSRSQKFFHDIGDSATAADKAYYAAMGSPLKNDANYKIAKGTQIQNEVPMDPKEAGQFFKDNLPPGFYAVRDSQGLYQLYYGYRVKGDQKAAAAQLEQNQHDYTSPWNKQKRSFQNQLSDAAATRGTVR